MERPSKRPRLSMFRDFDSTDAGLETARNHNDRRLKSRFEIIFEKYERDFTGVADEIDLATGRIVVDNGHLASMQGEKDISNTSSFSRNQSVRNRSAGSESSDEQHYDGGRILRAMTAAPPDFDMPRGGSEGDDDDDVLLLFERLAENASGRSISPEQIIKKETDSPSKRIIKPEESCSPALNGHDSDRDSLLDDLTRSLRSESPDSLLNGETSRERSTSVDSLMDEDLRSMRSSSQDSLFESSESKMYDPRQLYKSIEDTNVSVKDLNNDEAIIEQYGPEVGEQVLEVLRQRRAAEEARVEPAWRLPDIGHSFESLGAGPDRTHTPEPTSPAPDFVSPLESSLWMPRQTRKRRPKISPPRRRQDSEASVATEDSEDPLQEDFRDPINDRDAIKNWQHYIECSICPYCKQHKLHLSQHFRHMADRGQDGVHDIEYLDRYCRSRQVGEVTIKMFLDVVRYKELDNLGFVQIAERMGHSMQFVYNTYYQYRATQKSEEELAAEGRPFTQEEDDILRSSIKDENATFRMLRSDMKGRKIGEIGYRLATLHMRTFEEQGFQLSEPGVRRRTKPLAQQDWMRPEVYDRRREVYSSEDDLTGAPPRRSTSDDYDSLIDLTVSDG